MSETDKKRELYLRQKQLLDTFLAHGAITKAQYDKSFGDLTEKMGMTDLAKKPTVQVVAALIFDGDCFFICQRLAHKARGLLWEFVGGKVEPGETKEQALVRECREELDVTVSVGDVFMEVDHDYPDLFVHLTLFLCTIAEGTPQKLEHNDFRWITPAEISQFDFCPADEEILRRIEEKFGKP